MITELPEQNLEAHVDIERKVQETKFGTIVLTIRVHNGCITDTVYQQFMRTRFDLKKKPL